MVQSRCQRGAEPWRWDQRLSAPNVAVGFNSELRQSLGLVPEPAPDPWAELHTTGKSESSGAPPVIHSRERFVPSLWPLCFPGGIHKPDLSLTSFLLFPFPAWKQNPGKTTSLPRPSPGSCRGGMFVIRNLSGMLLGGCSGALGLGLSFTGDTGGDERRRNLIREVFWSPAEPAGCRGHGEGQECRRSSS